MHDETVDRTTNGRGKLSDLTLDEVKALRLKSACGTRGSRQEVPTLEEIMLLAKGKIMVNLDKVEGETVREAFEVLQNTGTADHAILKGRVPVREMRAKYGSLLDSILYMPIVWYDLEEDAANFIADYNRELAPVAYEMLFDTEDDPNLLIHIPKMNESGITVLNIALWDDLVAGHTDEQALLEGPDAAWGWLIEHGANAIMTDRPAELIEYLEAKGLR
jgi:glycerophosphoryl diester phosphodiesterase